MKNEVSKLLRNVVDLRANLAASHKTIDGSQAVKQYGAPVRNGERLKATGAFRETALGMIQRFRDVDLPRLTAEHQTKRAERLRFIERGGVPAPTRKTEAQLMAEGMLSSERFQYQLSHDLLDAFQVGLQAVAHEQAIAKAFMLAQVQSAQQLVSRLQTYSEAATAGGDFDYAGYAVDRHVLVPVLTARAASGDPNAAIFLQNHPPDEIEKSLLQATVGLDSEASAIIDRTENFINGSITGSGASARENLADLDGWLGTVRRSILHESAPGDPTPTSQEGTAHDKPASTEVVPPTRAA